MKKLLLILLSVNFVLAINPPEENIVKLGKGWYEITAFEDIVNITPEEARNKAVNRAYNRAVETHTGVEINSRVRLFSSEINDEIGIESFGEIINSLASGIILESEVISEKKQEISNDFWIYVVRVKVKVGQRKGERDPYFKLEANLDRSVYNNGDEIRLSVTPSKDCYLYVFNISSNDSVYVLLPNQYTSENFVRSGSTLQIPSEETRRRGIKYKVGLLPGKKSDTEMIKIIALKKSQDNLDMTFGNYQTALKKLQYFLVDLPRNEVVESNIIYSIVE
mgnify:CR=1 FL=1